VETHAGRPGEGAYVYMHDLDRLRRFVSACFVVMRINLTWAELSGLHVRQRGQEAVPQLGGVAIPPAQQIEWQWRARMASSTG